MSLQDRLARAPSPALWQQSLAPLLDVLFLLVIFLLVTANYDSERLLEVELPQAAGGSAKPELAPEERRVITLFEDASLAFNGESMSPQELREYLIQLPPQERLLPLTIAAATGARLGAALELLGQLRETGFTNAAFEVLPAPLADPQ